MESRISKLFRYLADNRMPLVYKDYTMLAFLNNIILEHTVKHYVVYRNGEYKWE